MSYELYVIHSLSVFIKEQLDLVESIKNDNSKFSNMSRCGAWNEIGMKRHYRDDIIQGKWDGRSPAKVDSIVYGGVLDYGEAWGNTKGWEE